MKWRTKFGKNIYVSSSGCKVFQNGLYRWLTFGSTALQTVINRRNPQKPVLHYLPVLSLMAESFPSTCCLLGLGGAGIAHLLSGKTPDQSIIAIESSEEVIHIAKQFFMVDSLPKLSIIHQNALEYLRNCTDQYPHILVDLYDANNYPKECATNEFFKLCKDKLTENGFIAFNLANLVEQWPIVHLIKNQFKVTVVIPVKKCANMIVIASKNDCGEWLIDKLRETGKIKRIVWVEAWGYVGEF